MAQCDSGNGMSEDGKGLCQREATKLVEENSARGNATYKMCKGCASHWTLTNPKTMSIVGDYVAAV